MSMSGHEQSRTMRGLMNDDRSVQSRQIPSYHRGASNLSGGSGGRPKLYRGDSNVSSYSAALSVGRKVRQARRQSFVGDQSTYSNRQSMGGSRARQNSAGDDQSVFSTLKFGRSSFSRQSFQAVPQNDDRSMASMSRQSRAPIPVSDERIALSMAIQHHSHKLMQSDVDLNDVWDMDDPLEDGDSVVSAHRKLTTSMTLETAGANDTEGWLSILQTPGITANKKHFLPVESQRIRLGLFIFAVIMSTCIAFYYGNGTFGINAAKFLNNEPIREGPKRPIDGNDDIVEVDTGDSPPASYPGDGLAQMNIAIPPLMELNLEESDVPFTIRNTAFFWQIPKAGGNAVRIVMSQCFKMVEASDLGAGFDTEPTLKILKSSSRGEKFLNVDTNSREGITRAAQLRLVESYLADVIISQHVHEIVELFSPQRRGKAFALFRHPMDVAMSMYKSSDAAAIMSIEEFYSSSDNVDNNWMVRFLTNKMGGSLTEVDLNQAMEILRRKFVIGMVDQIRESVKRFTMYFGWSTSEIPQTQVRACLSQVTQRTGTVEKIEEGSPLWNLILTHNQWDMMLFRYAQRLFMEQEHSLPQSPG